MIHVHANLVRNSKIVTAVNRKNERTGRLSNPFRYNREKFFDKEQLFNDSWTWN